MAVEEMIERVHSAYASLLVASVQPFSGEVTTSWRALFEGKRLARGLSTKVTLVAHRSVRQRLLLVVGGSDTAATPTRALAGFRLAVSPNTRVTVRFSVDDNGGVVITGPQDFAIEADVGLDLSRVLAETPNRVSEDSLTRLDLFLVVDRIGEQAAFEYRRDKAVKLAEELHAQFEVAGCFRLGYMAVADEVHVYAERAAAQQLPSPVETVRLDDPGQVLARLRKLRSATHLAYDYPGALRSAMRELQVVPWGALSHHVAIFLTSRPPHPPNAGRHGLLPSIDLPSWPTTLASTRHDAPMTPVLITYPSDWLDPSPALQQYLEETWRQMADLRLHYRETPETPIKVQGIVRDLLSALDLSDSLRLPEIAA